MEDLWNLLAWERQQNLNARLIKVQLSIHVSGSGNWTVYMLLWLLLGGCINTLHMKGDYIWHEGFYMM